MENSFLKKTTVFLFLFLFVPSCSDSQDATFIVKRQTEIRMSCICDTFFDGDYSQVHFYSCEYTYNILDSNRLYFCKIYYSSFVSCDDILVCKDYFGFNDTTYDNYNIVENDYSNATYYYETGKFKGGHGSFTIHS